MNRRGLLGLIFHALLCLSLPAHALGLGDSLGISPHKDWKTLETENFRVTFPHELEPVARKSALYLEEAHLILSPKLYWQPRSKTQVVVIDNSDLANGLTSSVLRLGMVFMVTPPDSTFSTDYYDDWLRLLAIHEYTHFLNMDPTRGWLEWARIIFGDVIRPNSLWTNWMLEGLAVYSETRHTHAGRGRSPYYEMILRAAVEEGTLDKPEFATLDRIHGPNPYFPAGETPYLFGYQLMNQVAKDELLRTGTMTRDGRQKMNGGEDALGIMSWRSAKRVPFLIDSNLENITGREWEDYWREWVRQTQIRMGKQLEILRAHNPTRPETLSEPGISILGTAISPNGEWLAYTQDSSDHRTGLYLKNTQNGEVDRITDKTHGVGLSFTQDSRYLFFSAPVRSGIYEIFNDIGVYDLQRSSLKWLTSSARFKDPDVSRDGKKLIFVSSADQRNSLYAADIQWEGNWPTLGQPRPVYTPDMYDRVSNPKWAKDSETIYFSFRQNGKAEARLMQVSVNQGRARDILKNGSNNRFPTVSPSGELYFVSDLTGVDNVYRLDAGHPKLVTQMTTGAWLPTVAGTSQKDETLYLSVLSSKGWRLAKTPISSQTWDLKRVTVSPPPAPVTDESSIQTQQAATQRSVGELGNYSIWPSIVPRQWAPILTSDFKTAYFGFQVLGFDALDRHEYAGYLAYDTFVKRGDGFVQYNNRSFGPTLSLAADYQTSEMGSSNGNLTYFKRKARGAAAISYPILWTFSNLTPRFGFQLEREFLYYAPDTSRLAASSRFVPSVDGTLTFSNAESSRLGLGPEQGRTIKGGARYYFDQDLSVWKALVSAREYLKLFDHAVLSPSIGASWISRTSNFSDAYVNIKGRTPQTVTTSDGTSERSFDALRIRGYPKLHILSRAAAVGALDLQFPLLRIYRGIGTLPVFFENLYGTAFAETTYFPPNPSRGSIQLPSAGGGLKFSTDILLNFPIIFALEYHHGFKEYYGGDSEIFFAAYLGALPF